MTRIPPQYARLGGLLQIDGLAHIITDVGRPVRFDDNGWPVEVEVETELCDPQPVMCTFVNGDGLPCLNEAEDGDGRCACHPVLSKDHKMAEGQLTGDDRQWIRI